MASANLDLVRSIFDAWERGEFGSAEWAHPELEFVIADGPTPGRWTGLAGMAQAWSEHMASFDGLRIEADELRELDAERVFALAHGSARGKRSGVELAEMQMRAAGLFHCRAGTVTRFVIYFDPERALADLGLDPEAGSPRS